MFLGNVSTKHDMRTPTTASREEQRESSLVCQVGMSGSAGLGGVGAVEPIPRDYHRRVLKKIAQLTKVIYALNTRNEEQESLVAELRTAYEERASEAEKRTAAELKETKERVRGACEEGEGRVAQARRRLEEEREQLKLNEASHKREVERLLTSVREEHKQKITGFVKELEEVSLQQNKQLETIQHLRAEAKSSREKRERELTEIHERKLRATEEFWRREVERCSAEAAQAKSEVERVAGELRERHRAELEAVRLSLEKEGGAAEGKRWEERERALREELRVKEEDLAQRASGLSGELRTAKDQLMLARQQVVEMTEKTERASGEVCYLQSQLEVVETEKEKLRETLELLRTRAESAEKEVEELKARISDKDELAAQLEAGHRQTVRELQSQLIALEKRLQEVEREKEAVASQHQSSLQEQSHSLSSVEKELLKLRRERDELHLQYAREIEAAHAKIGAREEQLMMQHRSQINEMEQLHDKALLGLQVEHEKSVEQVRCDLKSEMEGERRALCDSHREEVEGLERRLGEWEAQLTLTLSQLERARAALEERGRGLGKADEEMEKLRRENWELAEKERASQTEIQQLKELLERLRGELADRQERHARELGEVRNGVLKDTQAQCADTHRKELDALRSELSAAHAQSLRQALAALTAEKDSELSGARHRWEREQSSLKEKIIFLERRLADLQESSSVLLRESQNKAERQISELSLLLEKERQTFAGQIEAVERVHGEGMERVRREERERGRGEVQRIREEWQRECEQREVRRSEEVRAVREEGEREKREALNEEQENHHKLIASLQCELEQQYRTELEMVQRQGEREREGWRRERRQLESQREKEVGETTHQLEETQRAAQRLSGDLSTTRLSLCTAQEELALLRKQLELRSQELASAKREATNILRCREQELSSLHHAEVEGLASQYSQQMQLLLANINKAKKVMTAEIGQLQRRISELEHLYQSRESRREDVERIRELQIQVKQHQTRLRELEAEKQVYQLELVNREKNYNKLFSANPSVGVLDPLASSKQKMTKPGSASRQSSAPSFTGPKLPSLVSTASRLTASDVDLGGWSQPTRPRPQPAQSPLIRRTKNKVY